MSYRQYFPALAVAEGGRPYSIAEFATEKHERPSHEAAAYRDLELGQTQPGVRERPTRWNGSDAGSDTDTRRPPVIKTQGEIDSEYLDSQGSGSRHFEENETQA
jgi:hypothetical protein